MPRTSKKNISIEEPSISLVQPKINPVDPIFFTKLEENFKTERLEKIVEAYEKNVEKLLKEITYDLTIPNKLDDLINFNMGIGLIREKYFNAYGKILLKEKKLNHKLEVLEAALTQEYKRNPEVHNGILIQKDEVKNLLLINPKRIELQQELIHIKVLLDLYTRAMDEINKISFAITNQKDLYKLQMSLG